jgi:hypothetical protein
MGKFLANPFFTFTKIHVGVRNQHTFLAFINTPAGFSPLTPNLDLLRHLKGGATESPCALWRTPRPIAVSIRPLFTASAEVCSHCRLTALSWLPSFKCFACRQGPFCFLCALPFCHSCSPLVGSDQVLSCTTRLRSCPRWRSHSAPSGKSEGIGTRFDAVYQTSLDRPTRALSPRWPTSNPRSSAPSAPFVKGARTVLPVVWSL